VREILGFLAFLALPLAGCAVLRLEAVRRLGLAGRLALSTAAGALLVPVLMALMSLAGLQWSRTSIALALLPIIVVSLIGARLPRPRWEAFSIATLALLVLFAVGLLTARMTTGDFSFFWGPKGVRFYTAGGIDTAFLSYGDYFPLHRDYPPLLPLLYAWSNTWSRQFAWWGALLATALFLAATAAIAGSTSGDRRAGLLVVSVLGWGIADSSAAGGAEPLLLMFEALAIAAITFVKDERAANILAAIGLAGAAFTKVEGASFAVAVILAFLVVHRNVKRAAVIALPAILLLGGWLTYIRRAGLLDTYGSRGALLFENLFRVGREMFLAVDYRSSWFPWVVVLLLIATGNIRRAAFPILVAILTTGVAGYFYLHDPDPTWWIESSAPRVLLTPLTALVIAALAAIREDTDRADCLPQRRHM
jgi:hypothetical protein